MVEGPWFAASCRVAAPVKLSLSQRGPCAFPLRDLRRPYLLAQKFVALTLAVHAAHRLFAVARCPPSTKASHIRRLITLAKLSALIANHCHNWPWFGIGSPDNAGDVGRERWPTVAMEQQSEFLTPPSRIFATDAMTASHQIFSVRQSSSVPVPPTNHGAVVACDDGRVYTGSNFP